MDTTFVTVHKGCSFYNILVVDGEGESIIVACFLLRDNSFKSLFPIFSYLSKYNNFENCNFFSRIMIAVNVVLYGNFSQMLH